MSATPGGSLRGMLPLTALLVAVAPAPGGAREPVGRPLAPGDTLPELHGTLLSGEQITLPDRSLGAAVVLMLGFTYASRHDVETWGARVRREFAADSAIAWFEVPVIGGAARLARPFIDRGMRRGTPADLHGHVITVYGDAGDWKRRMGFGEPDVAYLLVLDRAGRVALRDRGPFEEARFARLVASARGLAR